jgi:hypothetical protein
VEKMAAAWFTVPYLNCPKDVDKLKISATPDNNDVDDGADDYYDRLAILTNSM